MIHHSLSDDPQEPGFNRHYAVGSNGRGKVLVQLADDGEQIRIPLTPERAAHLADLLRAAAERARDEPSKKLADASEALREAGDDGS